jgi:hypothetical protein
VSCTTPVSPPFWPNSSVPASVNYIVENRRRHIHVRWRNNGAVRLVMVFRTPSGPGAPRSARADVRRLLRLDGLRFRLPKFHSRQLRLSTRAGPEGELERVSDLLPQPDAPKVVECRERHNIS